MPGMKSVLFFLMIMLLPSVVSAETFYACNGGSGTSPESGICSGAWDIADLNSPSNWASSESNDNRIGPNDLVMFLDDGGWFRDSFRLPSSGLPGKPITFRAGPGEEPRIVPSERFTGSDWQLWYDSGEKKIYRLYVSKNGYMGYWNFWPVASYDSGATWFLPNMIKKENDWSETDVMNSLEDGWYAELPSKSNYYVYYRKDDQNIPETWEIGFRQKAVDFGTNGVNHVVWDGIDVFGPTGCNSDIYLTFPCSASVWNMKGSFMIGLRNNADLIIRNTEVSYGGFVAIDSLGSSSTDGVIIDNCDIHDVAFGMHFKGTYENHVPGSQGSKNITVQNSRIYNIGQRPLENGDRENIGLLWVDGAVIRNNYIGPQLHSMEGSVEHHSNQVAVVGSTDVIIENNYFYDAGHTHFASGGGATELTVKNLIIRGNVFDTWGYRMEDNDTKSIKGVQVGCCRNRNDVIEDCDNNYPELGSSCYEDNLGEVYITNNLFINSRSVQGWELDNSPSFWDHFWSTINVGYDKCDKLVISNNIFYKNPKMHELLLNPHWHTQKSTVFIEDNIFYSDSSSDWSSAVVMYTPNGPSWDYQHIDGSSAGDFNYDMPNTLGFPNVRGNRNVDPFLISILPDSENSKSLQEGSSAIDTGKDLGYGFSMGLNPASDFYGLVSVVDQNLYGSGWDIGPYVYTGDLPCTPDWDCSSCTAWSECTDGQQTRDCTCTDLNGCSPDYDDTESQGCVQTLNKSLIVMLTFDSQDITGTQVLDMSGNNNHGIIHGTTGSPGKFGEALTFNGQDDYVSISDSASLDFDKNQGTIMMWAKPENPADGVSRQLLAIDDDFQIEFNIQKDGDLYFYPWTDMDDTPPDNMRNYNLVTNPLAAGEWNHVAVTWNFSSKQVKIYVNLQKMTPDIENVPTEWVQIASTSMWNIGGSVNGFFNGSLDEVRIYNYALSSQEIIAMANPHRADTSPRDGCIEDHELIPFIDSWKYDSTAYPMSEMMGAVSMYYSPEAWCS